MPFIPRAQVQSVVQTTINAQASLTSSPGVGATSLTVNAIPSGMSVGSFVAISAATSTCEIRRVTGITATTITFTGSLLYSHSAGENLWVCPVDVPLSWYGAAGGAGSSYDNEPALQAAFSDWMFHQQNLDGMQLAYYIGAPLVQSGEMRLSNTYLYAMSSFAPTDTNGAMMMMADVAATPYQTATATASDNVFSVPSAHGLVVDDSTVLFKGTMPGGVTSGRKYYVKSVPSSTTFTVSATRGGTTLDVTGNGSCRAYLNLQALLRWYLTNVFIDGQNVAPVGMRCSVQQPGESKKVRVQNCTAVGAYIDGQDGSWWNLEITSCPTLLVIGGDPGLPVSAYQRFYQLNLEGTFDIGMQVFGHNNVVHDLHMEGGNANCVGVECNAETLIMDGNTYMNVNGGGAAALFHLVTGDFQAWNIDAPSASGDIILLDDDLNGDTVMWSDIRGDDRTSPIRLFDTRFTPSPQSGANSYKYVVRGASTREIRYGADLFSSHSMQFTPESGQTGDQIRVRDTSGNRISGFDKNGVIFTEKNSAPADADLVAGELTFWLDDTNGACKAMFKAKQADGTVRTGSVTLT